VSTTALGYTVFSSEVTSMAILIFGFKYRHKQEVGLVLYASLWLLRILLFVEVNELRLRMFLETFFHHQSPSVLIFYAFEDTMNSIESIVGMHRADANK
jgi:hypothetical protein